MLRCTNCNKHIPLLEAEGVKAELASIVHWETNVHGKTVPIVCPVCKNCDEFIQDRLILVEQAHLVNFREEADANIVSELLNDDIRDKVTLRYRCPKPDCTGIIQLNEDSFKVQPL